VYNDARLLCSLKSGFETLRAVGAGKVYLELNSPIGLDSVGSI
jgi:hypothetical protein